MDATQQNAIRSRVVGRSVGNDMIDAVLPDLEVLGPAGRQAFWESLMERATAALTKFAHPAGPELDRDTNRPMSDPAARAFGSEEMQFGKYAGQRIDEVPLGYLALLVDDNAFKRKLRRYLQSPRIKAELERTENEWE